jgi:hypothetical protein
MMAATIAILIFGIGVGGILTDMGRAWNMSQQRFVFGSFQIQQL